MCLSILGSSPWSMHLLAPFGLSCSKSPFLLQTSNQGGPPVRDLAFRWISSARTEHCLACTTPLGSASGSCLSSPVQQNIDLKISLFEIEDAERRSSVWQLASAGIWELGTAYFWTSMSLCWPCLHFCLTPAPSFLDFRPKMTGVWSLSTPRKRVRHC